MYSWSIALFLMLAALASTLVMPSRAVASAAIVEETASRAALDQQDTPTNRIRLAKARYELFEEQMKAAKERAGSDQEFFQKLVQALPYLQSATQLDPNNLKYWLVYASVTRMLGQSRNLGFDIETESAVRRILELAPTDKAARLTLIDILVRTQNYAEAAQQFTIFAFHHPKAVAGDLTMLGYMEQLFLFSDRPYDGLLLCDRLLAKQPDLLYPHLSKAVFYQYLNKDKQAQQELTLIKASSQQDARESAAALERHWQQQGGAR